MTTLFFFIFGACLGSFIPCFAERRQKNLSQIDRSRCLHCGQAIAPLYLVPILGYFFSSGHCRHCGAPIPKSLPFFETVVAILCALLSLSTAPALHTILLCSVFALLLLLSLDDWQLQQIHDSDLILYSVLLILDSVLYGAHFWLDQAIGAVIVALPLFIILRLFPQGLGSGDVLFMAISGFYLGTIAVTHAFLIGIFCALIYALYLIIIKKVRRDASLPLIPFLAAGVAVVALSTPFFG